MLRPMLGVISEWNGTIDLAVAKAAGIDAVILRMWDDQGVEDRRFANYVPHAESVGMPWGPSIWPLWGNHRDEAERAWALAHRHGTPDLSVMSIDTETNEDVTPPPPAVAAPWLHDLCADVVDITGKKAVIYTNQGSWRTMIAPAGVDFTDVAELRVARYVRDAAGNYLPPPKNPAEWEAWANLFPQFAPVALAGLPKWSAKQFAAAGNGRELLGPAASVNVSMNLVEDEALARWIATNEPTIADVLDAVDAVHGDLNDVAMRLLGISATVAGYEADFQEVLVAIRGLAVAHQSLNAKADRILAALTAAALTAAGALAGGSQ